MPNRKKKLCFFFILIIIILLEMLATLERNVLENLVSPNKELSP